MMKMAGLILCIFCFCAGTLFASAPNDELRADLVLRRQAMAREIGQDAMLILFSAPARNKTGDVDYEYRQDNNLFYLTGVTQADTILVLMPGNTERQEWIFVQDRDSSREHWNGKILSFDEVRDISGIQNVFSNSRFNAFIDSVLYQSPFDADRYVPKVKHGFEYFFQQLKTDQAHVYLCFDEKPGLEGEMTPEFKFANQLKERFFGFTIRDAWPSFEKLRQIKSAFEIKMLRETIDITAEAHLAAMKALKPGIWEYQIEAVIEDVYKKRNSFDWGFPSIVASGPNATILHYESSQRQAQDGELMLMDLGAEYDYYSADITRTVPVGGVFSAEQADIYQIVFEAQEAAMKLVKPGVLLSDVHRKAEEIVKAGLEKLGLITDTSGKQYKVYFTHGTSHWLGMDVHDAGDYSRPLEAGMVLTVEPGIYVRSNALELLAGTPENTELIQKVKPAFEKYKNIGVRIEDDVLVTADGYELLSSRAPRSRPEIESFMQKRN